MKPKLRELIIASFSFEESNPYLTKILILNAFLFVSSLVGLFSFFYNVFFTHNDLLILIDIFVFFLMVYALYQLREKENYETAAYIGTASLFTVLVAITILMQGKDFTLIWSYFFAPFAMIALGAKRGLFITIIFLSIILIAACYGIGKWHNEIWNVSSYIRFTLAHVVMLYAIYAISNSYDKAYERIDTLRQREQAQLKLFEKLSITDHLTSLYNRRSLKEIFPKEFYDAKRNNLYFAYFLLDIDYFKSYNDTYGHQKGDEALIAVSKLLNTKFKFAFRIGGDEFAGIMVSEKKDSIEHAINKLHHTFKALQIENRESPLGNYLTCSIGVHIINEFEYDFEEIYNLADTALYKAKALGRDQVIYL
jgi:diguanylate cyclase (GGDEF)-like protein